MMMMMMTTTTTRRFWFLLTAVCFQGGSGLQGIEPWLDFDLTLLSIKDQCCDINFLFVIISFDLNCSDPLFFIKLNVVLQMILTQTVRRSRMWVDLQEMTLHGFPGSVAWEAMSSSVRWTMSTFMMSSISVASVVRFPTMTTHLISLWMWSLLMVRRTYHGFFLGMINEADVTLLFLWY